MRLRSRTKYRRRTKKVPTTSCERDCQRFNSQTPIALASCRGAPNVIIHCQRSNPAKAPVSSRGAAHSRGVAQPGRAPGSGPGGRRFKSSLPDQSFQALKLHFWFSVYIDGVDFVDGACSDEFLSSFPREFQSAFPSQISLSLSSRTVSQSSIPLQKSPHWFAHMRMATQ